MEGLEMPFATEGIPAATYCSAFEEMMFHNRLKLLQTLNSIREIGCQSLTMCKTKFQSNFVFLQDKTAPCKKVAYFFAINKRGPLRGIRPKGMVSWQLFIVSPLVC